MKTRLKSLSNCYQNWAGVVLGRLYRSSCSGKVQATEGLKMSKIKDYMLELEQDFEYLSTTSMRWEKKTWLEQVEEGRFQVAESDWQYCYIHWFDNYASVVAAKMILRELEQSYAVKADDFTGQWAVLTNYESNVWKD